MAARRGRRAAPTGAPATPRRFEVFRPLPPSTEVVDARRDRRRMLRRALVGNCPLCGAAGLRRGWTGVADRCPACNLRLSRERGYLVGAAWFNLSATLIALLVVLVGGAALTAPDIPWGPLTAASMAAVVVTPVLFQPLAVALFLWLDLAYFRPLDVGDLAANDADPAPATTPRPPP